MYGSASELVREALRNFFDHLAGRELVDMKVLRQEMQARRQRALNNLNHLENVEEVFKELGCKTSDCLYKRELLERVRKIIRNPMLYPLNPDLGEGLRSVRHKIVVMCAQQRYHAHKKPFSCAQLVDAPQKTGFCVHIHIAPPFIRRSPAPSKHW